MNLPLRTFATSLAAIAAASLSSTSFSAEAEIYVLADSVQAKALAQLPPGRPARTLVAISRVDTVQNSANSNASMVVDNQASLVLQDNGLFATSSKFADRAGKVSGVSQSLSICGLIPLVTQGLVTSNTALSTTLLVGKVFLPFGVKSSSDWGTRARVVALETSAPHLCKPEPGTEFTYRVDIERQVKMSGPFASSKAVNIAEAYACKVASKALPSADLAANLKGDFLSVACESTDASIVKKQVEFAYLVESAFYIALSQQERAQSTRTQLSAVEYRP